MGETSAKKSKDEGAKAGNAPTETWKAMDKTLQLPEGMRPGAEEEAGAGAATFLGPYELVQMLGSGGMGSVWKARHTKLDKLVALKVLRQEFTRDADAISRFEREMKAVGKLEHTHIVRATDAGQADGVHYLVMEYIEGIDLSRLVRNRGPRSVKDACLMIRHAALGLAHAHEHGLVHRDIKPSNLLLSTKGLVKILDLGLARLHNERAAETSLTMQGEVMGTPDYMAPEQWQSAHTVGPAADLYALGCTLFHLLIGRPPFASEDTRSIGQQMKAHLLESAPSLKALRPDVPEEVDSLYRRLLAKEPEKRPESAKALADELRTMLRSWTQSPMQAETIAWPEGAVSGVRRGNSKRKAWAVIAGGVMAVAIVGAAILVAMNGRREGTRGEMDRRGAQKGGPAATERTTVAPVGLAPAAAIAPFNRAQANARQEAWAYYLGVPMEYTNSLGMRFCLIPPGEYERGTAEDRVIDLRRKSIKAKAVPSADADLGLKSESPQHHVRILDAFYLAIHEVTQAEYLQVMGTNPSFFSDSGKGRAKVAKRDRARLPVEMVSFEDAREFCRRVTQLDGTAVAGNSQTRTSKTSGYRLPTDAEWEFACRAGSTTKFHFGDAENDFRRFGREWSDSTIGVGVLQSNQFGLFDMHGNVWEICQDYFAVDDYASVGSEVDAPTGPVGGTSHVVRGGGYNSPYVLCRSASRAPFDEPRNNVGFRPALDVGFVRAKTANGSAPAAGSSAR
jgi:formylglycine-generating enzyme required for sulfatase activity/tRNA A-37 threonylcarbamoyl transferase component Bud32